MQKPDKVLRFRPLKELDAAVSKLKRVVLFHRKPIVEELPPQYCVCREDDGAEEVRGAVCRVLGLAPH